MLGKPFSELWNLSISQEIFVNVCKDAKLKLYFKKAYESTHLKIVQSGCSHSSQKPLKSKCVSLKKQILYICLDVEQITRLIFL